MIIHETIGMAKPIRAAYHLMENIEESFFVGVREKDGLSRIAPRRYMISSSGILYPQWSGHTRIIAHLFDISRPDPCFEIK